MNYEDMDAELYAHYQALDATLTKLATEEFKANRNENQPKQDLLRAAIRHIDTAMRELFLAGEVLNKGEGK